MTTIDTTATVVDTQTANPVQYVETDTYSMDFSDIGEAQMTYTTLAQLGLADKTEFKMSGNTASVTIAGVTPQELAKIERKVNIAQWSSKTIMVARKITNFAEDVADYALNGAIAPTAVAVSDAVITTGRVVGTATVKTAAGVASSVAKNGYAAVVDIKNAPEVNDLGQNLSKIWGGLSNSIFGSNNNSKWQKKVV